jgi:hypothetical protein
MIITATALVKRYQRSDNIPGYIHQVCHYEPILSFSWKCEIPCHAVPRGIKEKRYFEWWWRLILGGRVVTARQIS